MPLTRRRFVSTGLTLATTLQLQRAAHALGFARAADVCTLTAEQEVGPYYVADEMLRADITEGKAGIPLRLRLAVIDSRTCQPLPNAALDVWHCDALGLYSGFTAMNPRGPGGPGGAGGPGDAGGPGGPGGPPPGFDPEHPENHPGPREGHGFGPPMNKPTDKLTFLRGIQMTSPAGIAEFRTVFPGFYMGRTNHIHFKVRLGGHAAEPAGTHRHTYAAGHTSHTGQVFFPEELATELMGHPPYADHKIHRTTQAEDGIFNDQHGRLSLAGVTYREPGNVAAGLYAELVVAVDPTATPAAVGGPGGPRPGGPPPRAPGA